MPIDPSIPLGIRPAQFESPLQTLGSMMQLRGLQQQQQANGLQLQNQQRAVQDDQAMRGAIRKFSAPGGMPDFDAAAADLESQGFGTAALKLRDSVFDQRKKMADGYKVQQENLKTRLGLASQIAYGINDESTFQRAKKAIGGLLGPDLAGQLGDTYDPETVKKAMAWGMTAKEQADVQHQAAQDAAKALELQREGPKKAAEAVEAWTSAGSKAFSLTQDQQGWDKARGLASQLGMPPAVLDQFGPEWSPEAAQRAAQLGIDPAKRAELEGQKAARTETGRHNRANEAVDRARLSNEDASVPQLTPEALDTVAHQFAMTGQLPPMGMGAKAGHVRTEIINRAADLYKGLDLPSQAAAYKANRDSLGKMQGQRDAIAAFEDTAKKNIDTFLDAAGKVVDTGSPLANSLARQVSGKMLGSSKQAEYDAARAVVLPEIAKIVSNPGLNGVLSDSARKEIAEFNPASATLGQTVSVMRLLKRDMTNRTDSLDDQIKSITSRIARPPGARGTAAADAGVDVGGSGTVLMMTPDGRTLNVPAAQVSEAVRRGAKLVQ